MGGCHGKISQNNSQLVELSVCGYIRRIQNLINNMIIPNTIYQLCTSYVYMSNKLILYRSYYEADVQMCSINSIINKEKNKITTFDNILSINRHINQSIDHGWCGNAWQVDKATKCVSFIVSDIILPFDILQKNQSPMCKCDEQLNLVTITNSKYAKNRVMRKISKIQREYAYQCYFCNRNMCNEQKVYSCKNNDKTHEYIYCACTICATCPLTINNKKKCICDAELILIEAEKCYAKSKEIVCDGCNVSVLGKNKVYHCNNNTFNDRHKNGYYLCESCAKNTNNDNNKRYAILFEFGGKITKDDTNCKVYIDVNQQIDPQYNNVYLWKLPEPDENYTNFYGVAYSKYYGLIYIKQDQIYTLSLKDGINANWSNKWNKLSYKRANDDENYHCCIINDKFDNELLFLIDSKTKKVEIFNFLINESKPYKSMNYKIKPIQNCIYYNKYKNVVYVIGELTDDKYEEREREERERERQKRERERKQREETLLQLNELEIETILQLQNEMTTTFIAQCYIISKNKWINLPEIDLEYNRRYKTWRFSVKYKSYNSLCIWMEYNILYVTSIDWKCVKYLNVDSDKQWKTLLDKDKKVINLYHTFDKDRDDYCVYFIDVDNMKLLNEKLGHNGVDQKLKQIGNILNMYRDKSNTYWIDGGIIVNRIWPFRQGGDEFCVVVKGEKSKIKTQKGFIFEIKKKINSIGINVSIGVFCYGHFIKDANEWLNLADSALYAAKAVKGKNSLRIYDGYANGCQGGLVGGFEDINE
eukprot:110036_1